MRVHGFSQCWLQPLQQLMLLLQAGQVEHGGRPVIEHLGSNVPVGAQLLLHGLGHTEAGVCTAAPEALEQVGQADLQAV